MSLLAALLGGSTKRRRSRDPKAKQESTRVVFGGEKRKRLIHHGPLNAELQAVAYVGITDGRGELVISVSKGTKQEYRPSAVLPAPFEPVFAYRMFKLVDLAQEINVDEPDFQQYATAFAVARKQDGAPSDAVATYHRVRGALGAQQFDTAVAAWPTTQDVEQAVIACEEAGVPIDLDDVSQAVLEGHIAPNAWLIEHGVEATDVRRARKAEEAEFLDAVRPFFEAALKEADHVSECGCIAELESMALKLRSLVDELELLVGICLLRMFMNEAPLDMMGRLLSDDPSVLASPESLGIRMFTGALQRAADTLGKVYPAKRSGRELRWAIVGAMMDTAVALSAPKDDRK